MIVAQGSRVQLRRIRVRDLKVAAAHKFTLSIAEPLTDPLRARAVLDETGFWTQDAGAVAMEVDDRTVGSLQFYPAGASIHGYEIGHIVYSEDDRGKGYAIESLRLFSDLLFAERPHCHRLQMIIETWNATAARQAEDCGFAGEGTLRKAGYDEDGEPCDCFIFSKVRD